MRGYLFREMTIVNNDKIAVLYTINQDQYKWMNQDQYKLYIDPWFRIESLKFHLENGVLSSNWDDLTVVWCYRHYDDVCIREDQLVSSDWTPVYPEVMKWF